MTDVDAFRDAEYIADVSGVALDDAQPRSSAPASGTDSRVVKLQNTAKIACIDRLLRDLDILIYCELSALYYMDCSIILFAVRAVVELIFFTPKASPFDPTRNQPFVSAIIISNLFCMIFHAFFIQPEAGENARGYLHGGLFIDFIGQKPVPVFRLLSFDILVFVVDFVMLALIIERVKTAGTEDTSSSQAQANTDTGGSGAQHSSDRQDHDAEERGIMRGDENAVDANATVTSAPSVADVDEDLNTERTTLLADPGEGTSGQASRGGHPLDSFSAGQTVIMDMGLLDTIRDQWRYATTPRRQTGYGPTPETATFLRQRFGLQVGADGRFVRMGQ